MEGVAQTPQYPSPIPPRSSLPRRGFIRPSAMSHVVIPCLSRSRRRALVGVERDGLNKGEAEGSGSFSSMVTVSPMRREVGDASLRYAQIVNHYTNSPGRCRVLLVRAKLLLRV